jgi:hypothetical protein
MSYTLLERNFIAWAQSQERVRAAFVVGSRARSTSISHFPDEWSDLDIIVLVTDSSPYTSDASYLGEWADRRAISELSQILAAHHPPSLVTVLETSLALFRRLGQETADKLGYPYPQAEDDHISSWIEENYRQAQY